MPQSTTTSSNRLERLQQVYSETKHRLHRTHKGASQWLSQNGLDVEDFRRKSQQFLAATTLASGMILHSPVDMQVAHQVKALERSAQELAQEELMAELEQFFADLKVLVQQPPGHLAPEKEAYVEQHLTDLLGFAVTAELEGNRLNHSLGIMGGEQHLLRFPTDMLANHDAYLEAGIAPNRGAFGWFTENGELTEKAIDREKYYFAVQTLYLPNWNSDYSELKPWYQFRKMIVINPAEELAVVGVVADAGPAQWVQKQYGGSPEIIREGKIWSQSSRGRVFLFFVDDPEDQVPLGVVDLAKLKEQIILVAQG